MNVWTLSQSESTTNLVGEELQQNSNPATMMIMGCPSTSSD